MAKEKVLTLEELQAELEASQKSAADNLELANLAEKKCEETAAMLATLQAENATLSKVNDELSIVIDTLTKQVESKKTVADAAKEIADKKVPPVPTSMFTVDGKSYVFICPVFMFRKQRVIAAEAINNQDLLNELAAAKIGAIKPA